MTDTDTDILPDVPTSLTEQVLKVLIAISVVTGLSILFFTPKFQSPIAQPWFSIGIGNELLIASVFGIILGWNRIRVNKTMHGDYEVLPETAGLETLWADVQAVILFLTLVGLIFTANANPTGFLPYFTISTWAVATLLFGLIGVRGLLA